MEKENLTFKIASTIEANFYDGEIFYVTSSISDLVDLTYHA